MPETVSPGSVQPTPSKKNRPIQLTPELVKKIAERVFALMLADIRIDHERRRLFTQATPDSNRGHYGA
jgi:hypothetical protein